MPPLAATTCRVYNEAFPRAAFRAWGVLRFEAELSTIVYRAGFAPTPVEAKRMIRRGEILRNGVEARLPTQRCMPG